MKQLLTALHSAFLNAPLHHSISQRGTFSKYRSLLLIAGIALLIMGCEKENHQKQSVPFKGKMILTLGNNGQVSGTGDGTPSSMMSFRCTG